MLGKIVGFVLGVAKWALLLLGALVVALVWWLSSGDGKKSAPDAVPVVEQALPGAGACACSGGQVCEGPRGGRYCLSDNGGKRYLRAADK